MGLPVQYCRTAGAHAAQDAPREAGGLRRTPSAWALQSQLYTVRRRQSSFSPGQRPLHSRGAMSCKLAHESALISARSMTPSAAKGQRNPGVLVAGNVAHLTPRIPRISGNWLQVLGTTETPQIDQGVGHQFHPVVALLDVLETEEQPLAFVLPRKRPLDALP